MASDKRKIAYFGDKDNRETLEEEIYSGTIKTDEELNKRASELDVVLKISEDANKIRYIKDIVIGEVSSKGSFETKRKRIYGTTNSYQIIELSGSNLIRSQKGDNAIVVFGNKITKSIANDLINKRFKPSFSLRYIGDIFEDILREVSELTPSVGKKFNVIIKNPKLTKEEAEKYLDETVQRDVKLLGKFRQKLKQDLIDQSESIKMASKIVNKGEIGKILAIEGNVLRVSLNDDVEAFNFKWKRIAEPGGEVLMSCEDNDVENVQVNDLAIIDNETLCTKRNRVNLKCDVILCNV